MKVRQNPLAPLFAYAHCGDAGEANWKSGVCKAPVFQTKRDRLRQIQAIGFEETCWLSAYVGSNPAKKADESPTPRIFF